MYNDEDQWCHRWIKNQYKKIEIASQHQIKITFSHENNQNQNNHTMHDVV